MSRNAQIGFGIIFIIILGILLWWFTNMTPPVSSNNENIPPAGEITVAGKMECLPHRDTSGPQTLECAFGLLGDDDNHYALGSTQVPPVDIGGIPTGAYVQVYGVFTPREDTKYNSVGTIEVDSITEIGGNMGTGETTSDGTITFERPSDFGLAVTDEQILADAYIPPCDSGFDYCLYYYADQYDNTNFESAGLAIRTRMDLSTEQACLSTVPSGYSDLTPKESSHTNYSISMFAPLGDAAAGHYSTGEEYRVFASNTCYQFDTRIGETQYANYPEGTVEEFTDADRSAMLDRLHGIIESMTLNASGTNITLP